MKIVLGSPVIVRNSDGRKGHLVDIVLTQALDHSLIAVCFVSMDDGTAWWHGPSQFLMADPDGLYLTFDQNEHLKRLMQGLHVDTGKPLKNARHGRTTHRPPEGEDTA